MSEKSSTPHSISSTDFKRRQGHYLDAAIQGERVIVTRRGKPVVTLEAVQRVLPLRETKEMTKEQEELAEVAKNLDPYDLGRLIGLGRQMIDENLKKKAKR